VAVNLEHVLEPERLRAGAEGHRVLHRDDVAEDGLGGLVASIRLLGLGAGEAALGEHETLDPGRSEYTYAMISFSSWSRAMKLQIQAVRVFFFASTRIVVSSASTISIFGTSSSNRV
jgi:hypothetical protein